MPSISVLMRESHLCKVRLLLGYGNVVTEQKTARLQVSSITFSAEKCLGKLMARNGARTENIDRQASMMYSWTV